MAKICRVLMHYISLNLKEIRSIAIAVLGQGSINEITTEW